MTNSKFKFVLLGTLLCVFKSALYGQNPKAKISASTQCNVLNLLDSTDLASKGEWIEFAHLVDFGDNTTPDQTGQDCSISHSYAKTGTYELKVIISFTNYMNNNLIYDTLTEQVNITCMNSTKIASIEKSVALLNVYPNPFNGQLSLLNSSNENLSVKIYDLKGAQIITYDLQSGESALIDAENWVNDIYFLVTDKGERIKLIKY